jgi:hypothetical protein
MPNRAYHTTNMIENYCWLVFLGFLRVPVRKHTLSKNSFSCPENPYVKDLGGPLGPKIWVYYIQNDRLGHTILTANCKLIEVHGAEISHETC